MIRPGSRRAFLLLGAAAVAGIVAGTAAVYVTQSGTGNNAGDLACAGAVETAKKLQPLATGEVAGFRAADKGESLASVAFNTPDGAPTTLASLAGKVTLVNLWATWCVPCRAEMPALDRLEAAKGGANFAVVPINLDTRNVERAATFLADVGVTRLPLYADPSGGVLKDLKGRGLAIGLPTTILVDAKGCRLGVVEGAAEWDSADAQKLIDAAIGL